MTLRGTVQVNSEDIGAIAVVVCSSFLRKKKKTTTKNYFGTGHEKKGICLFSLKAHRFMTRNKRRAVDL